MSSNAANNRPDGLDAFGGPDTVNLWEAVGQDVMAEALMEAYRDVETDPVQLARAEAGFALAKEYERQKRECVCRCHQGWRQRIVAHGYRSCPCELWPHA